MTEEQESENRAKLENKGSETEDQKQDNELSVSKVSLGSRKVEFYFNLIKFPVIFAVVVGIVYSLTQNAFDLIWVVDFLAVGYVTVMLVKKHKGRFQEIAIACGMTGLLIGFFSALFKLIYSRKFYLIFNLISEPVITALVGIFVGLVIGYVLLNILPINGKKKNNNSLKRGGD